jgi:hypothetical protein
MALPARLVRVALLLLVALSFCAGTHHAPREFHKAVGSGSGSCTSLCYFFLLPDLMKK